MQVYDVVLTEKGVVLLHGSITAAERILREIVVLLG